MSVLFQKIGFVSKKYIFYWIPFSNILVIVGCYYLIAHSKDFFIKKAVKVKVAQSCPTLWDPMDYPVHGILQARILEWVAFPFSRGSSWPWNQTGVSCIAGGFFTNWAIREAQIIDVFQLGCWRSLLRVPWTARRSNQSIPKEINPKYWHFNTLTT